MNAETRRWFTVVSAAAGMLGLIGFAVSFERVSTAARPSFGLLAPAVPVGIDLGILVFSATGLLLAYLDMPARWLRLVPAALTAATIALNVAGERDLFGIVAHAVLPGLWVLAVAVAEHVVRHRLALDTGRRMDAVRLSRWLLAPLSTWGLWRRMVLWECRSYPDALGRERRRLLAVAALRDTYGPAWRLRAPRRLRVSHRLGELDPDAVRVPVGRGKPSRPADDASKTTDSTTGTDGAGKAGGRGAAGKRPGGRSAGGRAGGASGARSMDELRSALRAAIQAGRVDERRPSAEAIRRELACAPGKARTLRDELTSDPGGPVLASVGVPAGVEREGAA